MMEMFIIAGRIIPAIFYLKIGGFKMDDVYDKINENIIGIDIGKTVLLNGCTMINSSLLYLGCRINTK